MRSLFHIESEYLALASALEHSELTPELETALAINEQELQVKAVAYAYVIKDAEANIDAIDNEIARLTALKQGETRKVSGMRSAISNAMQLYGFNEVKTATLKLSFRKAEAVVCDTDTDLPDEFIRVVPETRKPDLTAIKAAIKEGREVEGYRIEVRSNLQIK